MRRIILGLLMLPIMAQAQTLEECQQAAERNYPLIQQFGLIEKTTELTMANIQKGWLPQVSASAQATLQSDVTAFPDQIMKVYQQMGEYSFLERSKLLLLLILQHQLYSFLLSSL